MLRRTTLVLTLSLAPAIVAAQQTPQAVPHDTVHGAVQAVSIPSRTLDVTTGVGFALRVVRLEVPPDVPVTDSVTRAPISLRDLQLGDIVRVQFGTRVGRELAYAIERVGRMERRPGSTP